MNHISPTYLSVRAGLSLLQMDFSVFWFTKMVDTWSHHKTDPFCAKELTPMKDLEFVRMFPSQRTAMTSSWNDFGD